MFAFPLTCLPSEESLLPVWGCLALVPPPPLGLCSAFGGSLVALCLPSGALGAAGLCWRRSSGRGAAFGAVSATGQRQQQVPAAAALEIGRCRCGRWPGGAAVLHCGAGASSPPSPFGTGTIRAGQQSRPCAGMPLFAEIMLFISPAGRAAPRTAQAPWLCLAAAPHPVLLLLLFSP